MLRRSILTVMLALVLASTASAYEIAVWVPYWSSAALASVQTNGANVQESNPVWYGINTDGTLSKFRNAESESWRAAMTGTAIVPTIQNVINVVNGDGGSWSGAAVAAIVADPVKRQVHEDAIVNTVVTNAFDGIDIDYEAVPSAAKADFTTFIGELASKLHLAGKTLSVTLPSKTSGMRFWAGPSWPDYPAIGVFADRVKIMAYDFHYSGGDPGPITPLDWLDEVAAYAERNLPHEKIEIGLPFYGYDWPAGQKAAGLTHANALSRAQTYGATIARDASSGEGTFTYTASGTSHTVYFNDAASYSAKRALLMEKHPAIKRLAHWAAGQEDPEIWNVIASDFRIDGPSGVIVQRGTSASAQLRLRGGTQFSGSTDVTVRSLSSALPSSALTLSSPTASVAEPVSLSVSPDASIQPGRYSVAVRFTNATFTHEQVIGVTVTAAPVSRSRGVRH